jgi:hypothetical protein
MPLQQIVFYLDGVEVATESLLDVSLQSLFFPDQRSFANNGSPILNLVEISSVGGGFCGA